MISCGLFLTLDLQPADPDWQAAAAAAAALFPRECSAFSREELLKWFQFMQTVSGVFRNSNNIWLILHFTLTLSLFYPYSKGEGLTSHVQERHSALGSRRPDCSPSGSWPPPSHCWWCWLPRTLRCTSLCPVCEPAGSPPGCYRDRQRNSARACVTMWEWRKIIFSLSVAIKSSSNSEKKKKVCLSLRWALLEGMEWYVALNLRWVLLEPTAGGHGDWDGGEESVTRCRAAGQAGWETDRLYYHPVTTHPHSKCLIIGTHLPHSPSSTNTHAYTEIHYLLWSDITCMQTTATCSKQKYPHFQLGTWAS